MKRPAKQTSVTGDRSASDSGSAAMHAARHSTLWARSASVPTRKNRAGGRPQKQRGAVSFEVTGGEETAEFPECCLVGRRREGGNFEWFGSGVLIHARIVLTAAHLGNGRPDVVALRTIDRELAGAEILDATFVPHEQFAQDLTHQDFALMFLASPSTTSVAAIASAAELNAATDVVLVGFGDNNTTGTAGFGTKRKATVPITAIRRDADTNLSASELALGFDATHEFVSGGNGVGVCDGDSGGPAYLVRNDGIPAVAGIAARRVQGPGNPCGLGTISTRVDAFMDFLADEAAAQGIQLDE